MKRNSLSSKLISTNMIIMLLPLIIIVYFVYSYFTRTVLAEKKNFNSYVSNDIAYSISTIISNINKISIALISDKAIHDFLVSESSDKSSDYLSLYTNALTALQALLLQESSIQDIYILADSQQSLHSGIGPSSTFFTPEEISKMDKSLGGWFWSYNGARLTMLRVIRNIDNFEEHIAYSKIVINTSAFYKKFSSENISRDMTFALLDVDGNILLHNLNEESLWLSGMIEDNPALLRDYNLKSFLVSNDDSSYNIFPQELRREKSFLVSFAVDRTREYHQFLYKIIVFLIMLFIVLVFIQTLIYNHFFIKPITVLGNLMKSIESEDFSVRFKMKVSSEIEVLMEKFNMMSSKLQFLYNEVYRNNLKLKEAEIKSLQSEINPHFLYNVLDSICWMIELRHTENAVKMVQRLSSLFRLSLYRTPDGLILFEAELEHAKCYIGIQHLRFINIKFTLDIQEGLENVYVMKLVLQPILENAIKHGLGPVGDQGEIILAVYTQGNDIIYYIYDSGVGMDLEKVREILKEDTTTVGTQGLALKNVNERLKLRFGNNYGISCHCPFDGGSIFIVKQPILYKKEFSND